ncbi:hypothetical protein J2X47_000536 [Sphingomonas sp. BE270]|nr:hypothetical protein [Sphingomonas sp. BE270]
MSAVIGSTPGSVISRLARGSAAARAVSNFVDCLIWTSSAARLSINGRMIAASSGFCANSAASLGALLGRRHLPHAQPDSLRRPRSWFVIDRSDFASCSRIVSCARTMCVVCCLTRTALNQAARASCVKPSGSCGLLLLTRVDSIPLAWRTQMQVAGRSCSISQW